jgi:hypothetical protein
MRLTFQFICTRCRLRIFYLVIKESSNLTIINTTDYNCFESRNVIDHHDEIYSKTIYLFSINLLSFITINEIQYYQYQIHFWLWTWFEFSNTIKFSVSCQNIHVIFWNATLIWLWNVILNRIKKTIWFCNKTNELQTFWHWFTSNMN